MLRGSIAHQGPWQGAVVSRASFPWHASWRVQTPGSRGVACMSSPAGSALLLADLPPQPRTGAMPYIRVPLCGPHASKSKAPPQSSKLSVPSLSPQLGSLPPSCVCCRTNTICGQNVFCRPSTEHLKASIIVSRAHTNCLNYRGVECVCSGGGGLCFSDSPPPSSGSAK